MKTNKDIFVEKLGFFIENKQLLKFTLSAPKDKQADLKKIIITAIELKKGYSLNFVYRHTTKDITKNFPIFQNRFTIC